MTGPHIRRATPADVANIIALDAALFGTDAWSGDAISAELAGNQPGQAFLVAVTSGSVSGYAVLRATAGVADLLRVGVAPGQQRAGVGTALLTAVAAAARAAACPRLLLEVARGNSAALGLYESLGFEVIATRPRYYPSGADALVLARSLSADPLDEQRDG